MVPQITFQDLEKAKAEGTLDKFIVESMNKYRASAEYNDMLDHEKYNCGENPFILNFRRIVHLSGDTDEGEDEGGSESRNKRRGVSIDMSPKIKIPSMFGGIISGHIVGRLWDNRVSVDDGIDLTALFGQEFQTECQEAALWACVHGVSYMFVNLDSVCVFKATNFLPLFDERTGEIMAGIRFWRLGNEKPWTVQLYEADGFSEWQRKDDALTVVCEKQSYTTNRPTGGEVYVRTTQATPGELPRKFPVRALYANPQRRSIYTQSLKQNIDVYDLKKTCYMDESVRERIVYWLIQGYGGDAKELSKLSERIRELGFIAAGDTQETKLEAVKAELPYLSHLAILESLEADIYVAARILNPKILLSGGVTTVAIRAAMQREDKMMVGVENMARQFIRELLAVKGVTSGRITFKHKTLVNELEIVQMLSQGVPNLPFEWAVRLNPAIPQEMEGEIIKAYEADEIGQSKRDILAYEAELERGQYMKDDVG